MNVLSGTLRNFLLKRLTGSLRMFTMSMVICFIISGSSQGQETGSVSEPEDIDPLESETQISISDGEEIGPMPMQETGEFPITEEIITLPTRPAQVSLYFDSTQQIPVIQTHGKYFDPSGWCSLGPMSEESNQSIRGEMLRIYDMGFRCFMLRVDWLSLEPEPNRIDATRVQELLQYANELGLMVIISLELDRAPEWFFRGQEGSDRIMVSRLADPLREQAIGNDGPLRWGNGTAIPLTYHPDTRREAGNLIYSLYYSLKDEPAWIGWHLSGPITDGFPGGGVDGIVGICDYSPYTVNLFHDITGLETMVYPLPRYSQGTWDQRPEFQMFWEYRREWRREAFDEIIRDLRFVDPDHLVLVSMDPVLSYRNDNGYLSMVKGPDSTRLLLHQGVDGAVIKFRLSGDTFDTLNTRSECSALHLAMTINHVARNGRIALVLVEADTENPPGPVEITDLAYMIKVAGAYPIWSSGYIQRRSHEWSWSEENAIERVQPLSLLPPPRRLRRGDVAIFDLPGFYSSFYAEQNGSISLSLMQLAIHQRTGVLLEYVSRDELLMSSNPVLEQYKNLIHLVPDLLSHSQTKASWLDPATQLILYSYAQTPGNMIEAADPMLLHQYELEDYRSVNLEDQLRTRYVHRGATADLLHGADAFILANDPYIFIRINSLQGARWIDLDLEGWPESNLDTIDAVDLTSGEPLQIEVVSGNASIPFTPSGENAHLFIVTDDYAPVADIYKDRMVGVTIAQQSRQMRRSVPAALLLAVLLAVTLVWMTFQSQQKSLIQAAELVDRRRRIEPVSILDEPEVMEFYKTYIAEQETEMETVSDDPESRSKQE